MWRVTFVSRGLENWPMNIKLIRENIIKKYCYKLPSLSCFVHWRIVCADTMFDRWAKCVIEGKAIKAGFRAPDNQQVDGLMSHSCPAFEKCRKSNLLLFTFLTIQHTSHVPGLTSPSPTHDIVNRSEMKLNAWRLTFVLICAESAWGFWLIYKPPPTTWLW